MSSEDCGMICLTCGSKQGTYHPEQDGTITWTCGRCGDEWSDIDRKDS